MYCERALSRALHLQRESWVPAETQWHGTYQGCCRSFLFWRYSCWAICWQWHQHDQRFRLRKYRWALARKEEELTANSPNLVPAPTQLWESTGPCTLPTTRKLRARRDAVKRNIPKLLPVILILAAFLLSHLSAVAPARPAISSSKIQMRVGQKRGRVNR